jgi:HAD superfamily hydrolase (TIGR01509 family)
MAVGKTLFPQAKHELHGLKLHTPMTRVDHRSHDEAPRKSSARQIRGVIFDAGGVLYDATLGRRMLWRLLNRIGLKIDYRTFFDCWDRDYLSQVCGGRREYGEALQAFLLAQGLSWAQIDEVEAASRPDRQFLETGARLLPGVATALNGLSSVGMTLAVLANSPLRGAELSCMLDQLGLAGRFQAVASSCDLEVTKPAVECYQAALRGLNLPAEEVVYVGHDARYLAGAKSAGLRVVAINHEAGVTADWHISRLDQLVAIATSPPPATGMN